VKRLCTFQIGPHTCALDVASVREVIQPGLPAPVPRAPAGIPGVFAHRGQVLTAYDLLPRMGLPPRLRPQAPFGIVLDGELCLLVDEVGEVAAVDPSRIETPPRALIEGFEAMVETAYRGRHNLFLVLSADGIRP